MFTDISPQLLRAVIDCSLTPIYAASAIRDKVTGELIDFQIYLGNPAFCHQVGFAEPDLLGQTLRMLFPILDKSDIVDHYRRVVETGEAFEGAQETTGPDGSVWHQVRVNKLDDGIVVNVIDLTDSPQGEAASRQQAQLWQANQQLEATLDASIISILAMTALRNEQGQIVDFIIDKANRWVERSLGKTPAELEGLTLLSVYPGNVESGFFALYAKAADTGEQQQTTQHYTDVNGYEGWFEASAVRYAPDKIVLTFMNVTQYKQTEKLVREQADLVQNVLNATMNTVAAYEAIRDETNRIVDFRFTLANQAALDVVNLTADQLYGKSLLEISPDLRHSAVLDQYVAVVETGQPTTLERHRQDRWFLAHAVRFGDDGMLTSSIDITSAKQAQLQIEQLNQQLQRSNANLEQFASVASHDLQEPLRKIKSFGDMLMNQYAPALGEGVTLLGRMQSAAERMQTLIRDLLAYARLSNEALMAHQPVDLNHLLAEVVTDLDVAIAEKEAVIDIGSLPTLTGDPLQLRQVFQNLLSNALKFTQPGRRPKVTITAERVEITELLPDEVNLGAGSYWLITVADNGIGFGEKYREKIFGAFERLHGKSSGYGGTGIGLAIVRRVLDNHHGVVTAHSVEDEGATFRLYFLASD